MKKGVFITYPGMHGVPRRDPWKEFEYNNRKHDIPVGDGILTLLKRFTPKGAVKSAKLRITALGIFEALMNGKRIGKDGVFDELAPTWTDYKFRVFEYEYDLADYLKKKGENVFCVRVSDGWWAGRISYNYYGNKAPALCAEIELTYKDGKTEIIATDESWQAAITGPVTFADIYDGEAFDARMPDPAVKPDLVEFVAAERFDGFEGKIVPFQGEPVRVKEYIAPKSATVWHGTKKNGSEFGKIKTLKKAVGDNCEQLTLKAGQHLMLDFGENIVGRPAFGIYAQNGTQIKFLFAEMLNDSGVRERGNDGPEGSIYIENYRSARARLNYTAAASGIKKELNIFRPLHTFYGFRYVEITADRDIKVECVTGEVVGSTVKEYGKFECSNAEVNQLFKNVVRGMRGNYLSVPTDCPQRDERLGWTGDAQLFCGAASYIGDTYEFMRKWLGDARDSQIGYEGAYCDIMPRVFNNDFHSGKGAWADCGVIVPYRMWQFFGDEEIVAENYDAMEYYMQYLERYGLVGPKPYFGDWLNYEKTSKHYISKCYYAYDAAILEKFSEILGKEDRRKYYHDLRKRIVDSFIEEYVVDGEIKEKTQTAYVLALAFDMINGELREKTIKLLEKKIIDNDYTLSTGFVGTGLLNQTLSEVGLDKVAYSLLLQTKDPSWLYSVRQGATTIWERWNSYTKATGFGKVSMNSFNHYAYGAVAEWMFSAMAGIKYDPENPGFTEHFILAPSVDLRTDKEIPEGQERITMVNAETRGIKSRWEYENGRFVWRFTIPYGSARVEFPLLYGQKTIEINGVTFKPTELDATIANKKMIFELGVGEYTVR